MVHDPVVVEVAIFGKSCIDGALIETKQERLQQLVWMRMFI